MFAQKQNENRPLQYFFSQRSNPLDPDEDGLKSDKKSSSNEPKFHYLPSFPLTVEDFMKDSKSNSLKNSSRNTGRILLPNPYPKKNSQRNSLINDEASENHKSSNNEKNEHDIEIENKSRKNSFSVEEFKEYNKKFQGKKLSERLDIISKEYENKVMGDLKKIEEKILESKPTNLVIVKTQITPPKNTQNDFSLNDAVSKDNIFEEKVHNTNETLNERCISNEKKHEKLASSNKKKQFSTNSKFEQTNELEYSPFTNKASAEVSNSYLLGTQSHQKDFLKIDDGSNLNSSFKEANIYKINEKIRKDSEFIQHKNFFNKKKDFLIQTNISPSNENFIAEFRNLNVSPIDDSISNKSGKPKTSYFYSEKKNKINNENYMNNNTTHSKKDKICQANFESFDQYFVSKYDFKKNKCDNDYTDNFNSIGEPLNDPSKCLDFDEEKDQYLMEQKQNEEKNSFENQDSLNRKFENLKILQEKVLEIEQKALNLLRSEESEKALELLLANEHVIERIFKNFHPQRLYICYLISYCFLKLRNFDSCEFYNQKAFKILKNNECFKYEINCLYAYYILKISGLVAMERKKFEHAIQNFQKMLNLYNLRKQIFAIEENGNNEIFYSKEFLNIYYNLSSAYLEIDKKTEAAFYLKELENNMEKDDTRYFAIKLKLADLFSERKNFDQALEYYIDLIKKVNKNFFSQSDTIEILVHIYESIGIIYYEMKKYTECFSYFEKCIELNSGNTKKKGFYLFFLGKVSNSLKQSSQAFNYFQKALSIFDRFEGINNTYSIKCIINMAQIKYSLKEYASCFELYEKSLQNYITKFGNNHMFVYILYLNVIYIAVLLKENQKKEKYYSEILEKCCSQENYNSFVIYNEIGNMFRNLTNFSEAIINYSSAIKCSKNLKNEDLNFQVCLVHYNLALCYQQTNNIKESINNNRICLEMNKNLENERNISFQIKVLYNLAALYEKINRMSEANAYIKQGKLLEKKLENPA